MEFNRKGLARLYSFMVVTNGHVNVMRSADGRRRGEGGRRGARREVRSMEFNSELMATKCRDFV